jgi:hypothetical protein
LPSGVEVEIKAWWVWWTLSGFLNPDRVFSYSTTVNVGKFFLTYLQTLFPLEANKVALGK